MTTSASVLCTVLRLLILLGSQTLGTVLGTPVLDHLAVATDPSGSAGLVVHDEICPSEVNDAVGGDQVTHVLNGGLETEAKELCRIVGQSAISTKSLTNTHHAVQVRETACTQPAVAHRCLCCP